MVASCVAYGCANRLKKGCGLTFHLFPKDPELRSLWERAVRRERWHAKDGDRLCCVHFAPECFDRTGQTTRLRAGSVPSVFPAFPEHLQKPMSMKRPGRKHEDTPANNCSPPHEKSEAEEEPPVPSPTKQWYKEKVSASEEEITQLKKKVKTFQQTKRRLTKRNETAQEIIKEIRDQKLLSEEGSQVFTSSFSIDIQQLLNRAGNKQKGVYTPELRAFALTLHFYSPAAYDYVRSKFNDALPSQRTLRQWYRSVHGAPGFTDEAFCFLQKFTQSRMSHSTAL
ncbi:THAP domain-containing protein 2-like [Amblyomma americanum]